MLRHVITAAPSANITAQTFARLTTTTANYDTCSVPTSGAADGVYTSDVSDYTTGQRASIQTAGIATLIVTGNGTGGAIAAGDYLKPGTSGYGVLAAHGEVAGAKALDPATGAADIIRVEVHPRTLAAYPPSDAVTDATATVTLSGSAAIKTIKTTAKYVLTCSYAGVVAVAFPGASSIPAGIIIRVKKTGAGTDAITITPASGTIVGGATYASLDTVNDVAEFISDGISNWALGSNDIAP